MGYTLYIDESGDPGIYIKNHPRYGSSSPFFTLAGILIAEDGVKKMEDDISAIRQKYFKLETLPPDFKLHYSRLIQNVYPYSILDGENRRRLADEMFQIIINTPCTLLSVTLDLNDHYQRYIYPADPKAYTLLIMLERFQNFLSDEQSTGSAVYERFRHTERVRVQKTIEELSLRLSSKHHVELNNIVGDVQDGDPVDQPILQLADFFAYAVQIKAVSESKKHSRWLSVRSKYYKLDGGFYESGYVRR